MDPSRHRAASIDKTSPPSRPSRRAHLNDRRSNLSLTQRKRDLLARKLRLLHRQNLQLDSLRFCQNPLIQTGHIFRDRVTGNFIRPLLCFRSSFLYRNVGIEIACGIAPRASQDEGTCAFREISWQLAGLPLSNFVTFCSCATPFGEHGTRFALIPFLLPRGGFRFFRPETPPEHPRKPLKSANNPMHLP